MSLLMPSMGGKAIVDGKPRVVLLWLISRVVIGCSASPRTRAAASRALAFFADLGFFDFATAAMTVGPLASTRR
jgi:hypothetical protein